MLSVPGIQCGAMWVPTNVNNCGEVAMGPYCNGPDQMLKCSERGFGLCLF